MRFIAILGAESTGKTVLTQALATHWRAAGQSVTVVAEVLREWCDHAGRTPYPHEQQAIAQEQARRTLAAEQSHVDVVLVDTTPLMTAIYSHLLFQDPSLYAFALSHHHIYHQTLLMGLDLPWVADGIQRDSPAAQAPVDALVRQALGHAGMAFQIIYGTGESRLHHALRATTHADSAIMFTKNTSKSIANNAIDTGAIDLKSNVLIAKTAETAPTPPASPWVWQCDTCSDPACEHRLFTGLL
jgi:HTH-type transcriptional regulator, transcriptional repressor of NAD biosynthesis genes